MWVCKLTPVWATPSQTLLQWHKVANKDACLLQRYTWRLCLSSVPSLCERVYISDKTAWVASSTSHRLAYLTAHPSPNITLVGRILTDVQYYIYLESMVSRKWRIDNEVEKRVVICYRCLWQASSQTVNSAWNERLQNVQCLPSYSASLCLCLSPSLLKMHNVVVNTLIFTNYDLT